MEYSVIKYCIIFWTLCSVFNILSSIKNNITKHWSVFFVVTLLTLTTTLKTEYLTAKKWTLKKSFLFLKSTVFQRKKCLQEIALQTSKRLEGDKKPDTIWFVLTAGNSQTVSVVSFCECEVDYRSTRPTDQSPWFSASMLMSMPPTESKKTVAWRMKRISQVVEPRTLVLLFQISK